MLYQNMNEQKMPVFQSTFENLIVAIYATANDVKLKILGGRRICSTQSIYKGMYWFKSGLMQKK